VTILPALARARSRGDGAGLMNVLVGHTKVLIDGQPKPFYIDLSRGVFRHMWVLGKSGTGKSTFLKLIIAEAIRQGLGVWVIDPHGDLIADALNYIPESRVRDLLYLDPESSRIPDIGILDYPDKNRALRVVMTLFEAHGGEGWGKQTASILRNLTRAALELHKHTNIVHVYTLLADDEYADRMLQKCKNPLTRRFHKTWWSMQKKDRINAFSHPLNKIEELMEPGLVEFFGQKKSLNFRQLMDDQKIVFCRLPKSYLEERGTQILGSFIMMKLKVEATRRKHRGRPVLIIADEYHNFIKGIDVDTTFGESRKFGTHYIVTSQTRTQLGAAADVIAGNVSHIVAFRMAAVDAKEITENFGEDRGDFSKLVMLPNFQFRALTMDDADPISSEKVCLLDSPPMHGDEVPARKAMAWAAANTGADRALVMKHIEEQLS
jgi:hypothetical protein